MSKVSIIVPSRNERFLQRTVADLLVKANGEIEIIVVLDGYWPDPPVPEDPRVKVVHIGKAVGMRHAIMMAAEVATGKYLMKCDAHVLFKEGFDLALTSPLEHNWVAAPTRYRLDGETWEKKVGRRIDYQYLNFPNNEQDFGGAHLTGRLWYERNSDRALEKVNPDDLMSAQGSCWIMHRAYFKELELYDPGYEHWGNEFNEISLKTWLSGGRVIRNKSTWYAHLFKGKQWGRGWKLDKKVLYGSNAHVNKWMTQRMWHKQDRDIRWLVDKFWPVPTWPEESVRLVFNRRKGTGSGKIRGVQMAEHFKARINPPKDWRYDFDVHVWVKEPPREPLPPNSYLDVLDNPRAVGWLKKHPECGVIASSASGQEYLRDELGRDDVHLIPQHHVNPERVTRQREGIAVAGVVGGPGAIQCNVDDLTKMLGDLGVEFRWLQDAKTPADIVEFYKGIDVQIVWREQQRPLKNPLKLVNAMSFGIPTLAFPETAYSEIEGFFRPIRSLEDIANGIVELRQCFYAENLIAKADEYHIDTIAKRYKEIL